MCTFGPTSISSVRRALACLVLLGALPAAGAGLPQPVSPGAIRAGAVSEARCPTFSWSGVPGARGYKLAVFRVSDELGKEPALVTRASVPGDARGFTPPMDQCLERGQRYAWSVAASTGNTERELAWAPAFLFEVAKAPALEDLEQAMATIQRYLASEREPGARRASPGGASSTLDSEGSTDGRGSRPRGVARGERLTQDSPLGDILPGAPTAPTVSRVTSAAAAPAFGDAALTVDQQIHLAEASAFFKTGSVFLWDDEIGNTALGRRALTALTEGAQHNTAIGWEALRNTDGGGHPGYASFNTGVGDQALHANTIGRANTATGFGALHANTTGALNTASGHLVHRANVSGYRNTASGASALYSAAFADANTAIGAYALFATSTGGHNTALGYRAGVSNTTGNDSIFIGNPGSATDDETIRIGTYGVQATAFLAGDVGLGFASGTPTNRLHVRDSISGSGYVPGNHVVQIENTSTGDGADVLALKVGLNHVDGMAGSQVNAGMNFVTFFDGDNTILGEIQGTLAGGIEFVSGNADFAEWLPRLDPAEAIEPGDVVGLHGGALSKRTQGASRVFVVSTAPLVTGNDPGEEHQNEHARVAFLGQAPVKVRGPVRAGDLLVASGQGDGVAVARAPHDLSSEEAAAVVGRALEASTSTSLRPVRALVGLDTREASSAEPAPQRGLERELARLERRVRELEAMLHVAETRSRDGQAPTRRR